MTSEGGIYDQPVDFAALALVDADFATIYNGGRIDLKDPEALQ